MNATAAGINGMRTTLARCLVERDEQVEMLLLGLISEQNVCLVGPPGVGKSYLCDSFAQTIDDCEHFGTLMHKFLPPDELVGQMSVTEFKKDNYVRKIEGFAPTADLIFLDEIWKASPALLNTLLKLLNERTFRNGTDVVECRMRSCFAASNEWPVGEGYETTAALYDRFLIRGVVRPVSDANRRRLMLGTQPDIQPITTMDEIDDAIIAASELDVSEPAWKAVVEILDLLKKEGIEIGDRRLRASMDVVRAAAYLDDADEVEPHHLECLKYVYWTDPVEHPAVVQAIVEKIANPVGSEINTILAEVQEAMDGCDESGNDLDVSAQRLSVLRKLKSCRERVKALPGANGRGTQAATYIQERMEEVRELCGL